MTVLEWLCPVMLAAAMAVTACSPEFDEANAERSGESSDTSAAANDDGITVDTFPPARPSGRSSDEVDATAANDAVPPGMELKFESAHFDLDEEGDHSASLVVPVGWESRLFIGVEFAPEPDAGFGFFTKIKVILIKEVFIPSLPIKILPMYTLCLQ